MLWRGLRTLGFARMYNEDYQWAYTPKSLRAQLERAGFAVEEGVYLCEGCADSATCKHRREYLAIAHRL